MTGQSYSTLIQISAEPRRVYESLTAGVDKWWTRSANRAVREGDQLVVRFERGTRWVMTVVEAVPDRSLVWRVDEAHHSLPGVQRPDEWRGTTIEWEIHKTETGSGVSLRHEGLVPILECYEICQAGWVHFLGSLKDYLEVGTGYPFDGSTSE